MNKQLYCNIEIYPGPAEPGLSLPLQTVCPDQLASGSALLVIKYENLYQQPSNLIGWQLDVGVAS